MIKNIDKVKKKIYYEHNTDRKSGEYKGLKVGEFMKISTKGRYGIRALIDLVINSECGSVTLKAISERQEISERYLEQIFSLLRKSGLIIGRKGAQGGYTLSKSPNEITIGEILRALEGESLLIDINYENSNDIEMFVNKVIWSEINKKINDYFDSITLDYIVEQYRKEKEEIIYYI